LAGFVNSQLVCLPPVGILNLVMFIRIFIYYCLFTLVLKNPNGEWPIKCIFFFCALCVCQSDFTLCSSCVFLGSTIYLWKGVAWVRANRGKPSFSHVQLFSLLHLKVIFYSHPKLSHTPEKGSNCHAGYTTENIFYSQVNFHSMHFFTPSNIQEFKNKQNCLENNTLPLICYIRQVIKFNFLIKSSINAIVIVWGFVTAIIKSTIEYIQVRLKHY